jgi:3-polyprenyl-4-hydroxybenzoate decarboxylase
MIQETVTPLITGACAAEYTLRLFRCCLQNNIHVQFVTSQPGQGVAARDTPFASI